jgi:hypothetical protein
MGRVLDMKGCCGTRGDRTYEWPHALQGQCEDPDLEKKIMVDRPSNVAVVPDT